MHTHDQSLGTLTDNYPQEHTLCLPPKAIARLGKGGVSAVTTSPDGTLVAVLSRIGVWLYDAHTDDFVALIAVEGTGDSRENCFFTRWHPNCCRRLGWQDDTVGC